MGQAASSDLQIWSLQLKGECESQGLPAEPRGRGSRAKAAQDGLWEARRPGASISTRKEDAVRPSHVSHLPLGRQRSRLWKAGATCCSKTTQGPK